MVVLAHSLHGRLRRIHIPHQALYVVLALALFGGVSLIGAASTYLRMTWEVAGYNSLRDEAATLRSRYQELLRENGQKSQQLASLELMASEVSAAYGLRPAEAISSEPDGPLVPTFSESLDQYQFLRTAYISRMNRTYTRPGQRNITLSFWPVNGRLLSGFGTRVDPFSRESGLHPGVDLSAAMGTPVRAAADGIVDSAETYAGYGRLVVVDHGNGVQTWYAHLSRYAVVPGQEIRKGQILAYSGATGRVTSPHLHFEVRVGGLAVNPYPYLARSSVLREVPPDLPF